MAIWDKVMAAFEFNDDDYEEYEVVGQDEEFEGQEDKKFTRSSRKLQEIHSASGRKSAKKYPDSSSGDLSDRRKRLSGSDRDNNVIQMSGDTDRTIANYCLDSFDDVKKVSAQLKLNRVIFVDLHNLEKFEAQRALDFLCGVCEGLNADIQKASSIGYMFILTPNGVHTINDDKEELRYKGVFPWIK